MKRIYYLLIAIITIFLTYCSSDKETGYSESKLAGLGKKGFISISSTDIQQSQNFYQKLGFKPLENRLEGPNPWALLSNGQVELMISQNRFPSPALTYFAHNMEKRLKKLQQEGVVISNIIRSEGKFISAVLMDPNGLGITLIQFNEKDLPESKKITPDTQFLFSNLSLPTKDLKHSVEFWQKLGFQITNQSNNPYPRAKMTDGVITIALLQTDDFTRPILNFILRTDQLPQKVLEKCGLLQERDSLNDSTGQILLQSPDGDKIVIESQKL